MKLYIINIIVYINNNKMSEFDQIIQNMNASEIDANSSDKYTQIIEYYKMLVVKIIICSEATLYKICTANQFDENLNNSSIYEHISVFVQKLLLDITEDKSEEDIKYNIKQISLISENSSETIHDKIFFLIYNFYSNFDRSKIPIEDYEKFKDYIVKKIVIFFKNNLAGLLDVIKDNEYSWEGEYSLDNLETYYDSDQDDD